MGNRILNPIIFLLAFCLLAGCGVKTTGGAASDRATAQALVDEATQMLADSLDADAQGVLHKLIRDAKGVMVIPAVGDISFIFSLGGGNAVLVADTDKGWAGPVFMSKGTVGFGLQAGVYKQSGILLFMHGDDVRYLVETGTVFKGQARLVVLTTDYEYNETPEFYESGDVYFVGERSGLYAGVAMGGGGFSDRPGLNEAFTGVQGGGPETILYDRGVRPHGAERLFELLDRAGRSVSLEKEKDGTLVPSD